MSAIAAVLAVLIWLLLSLLCASFPCSVLSFYLRDYLYIYYMGTVNQYVDTPSEPALG